MRVPWGVLGTSWAGPAEAPYRPRLLQLPKQGARRFTSRCPSPFYSFVFSALRSDCCSPSPVVDLSEYLLAGRDWRRAPKCPDYIGPVCIKRTPDGRGRGLYATRDVTRGDLLLIGNPIAASYNDSYCVQLLPKICAVLKESPWALHRYCLLAGCENQEVKEIPPVELFDPNTPCTESQATGTPDFDVKHILDIMRINSFEAKLYSSDTEAPTKLNGMYLLPSLINHSCFRNANRLFVGEAMVVYAAQNIQENEEITTEYTAGLLPLKKRENLLESVGYGFRCACTRCVLERSVQEHLEEFNAQFVTLYEKAYEEIRAMLATGKTLSLSACKELGTAYHEVRKKTGTFDHLTTTEKQWILGGFSSAFLGNWFTMGYLTGFAESSVFVNPIALELLDAMKATIPGATNTLSFAMLLNTIAQREDFELANRLLQISKGECIAAYGKQRTDVMTELIVRSVERAPYC